MYVLRSASFKPLNPFDSRQHAPNQSPSLTGSLSHFSLLWTPVFSRHGFCNCFLMRYYSFLEQTFSSVNLSTPMRLLHALSLSLSLSPSLGYLSLFLSLSFSLFLSVSISLCPSLVPSPLSFSVSLSCSTFSLSTKTRPLQDVSYFSANSDDHPSQCLHSLTPASDPALKRTKQPSPSGLHSVSF